MGQVLGPIYGVLDKGMPVECSTTTREGVAFLVAQGVGQLYEVLLSTHAACDWGARADPVLDKLQYRPFLLSRNDKDTIVDIPLISTGRSTLGCASATAFVCVT